MKNPRVLIKHHLHRFARSRWALSTVVTTLIIVVISVLLAGVVTYFAINVTSTRVQEESLALTKQHVWYDSANGKAQAAIMVINAGGKDVVIDKLTVRGQACAWSKVFFAVTSDSISSDLFFNTTLVDGGSISVGGSNRVFKQATGDLTLQSGRTLIIYLSNPDSISVNDVGLTVSVNIFTSQSMYYKETNVQGTGGTQTVSSSPAQQGLIMSFASAYYCYTTQDTYEVGTVIINSGNSDESIELNDFIINGQQPTDITAFGYYASSSLQATSDLPYLEWADTPVQSHTLSWIITSFTLHAGETAIVYFWGDGVVQKSDIGTHISVGITLDAGGSLTKSATIEEYKPV